MMTLLTVVAILLFWGSFYKNILEGHVGVISRFGCFKRTMPAMRLLLRLEYEQKSCPILGDYLFSAPLHFDEVVTASMARVVAAVNERDAAENSNSGSTIFIDSSPSVPNTIMQ